MVAMIPVKVERIKFFMRYWGSKEDSGKLIQHTHFPLVSDL